MAPSMATQKMVNNTNQKSCYEAEIKRQMRAVPTAAMKTAAKSMQSLQKSAVQLMQASSECCGFRSKCIGGDTSKPKQSPGGDSSERSKIDISSAIQPYNPKDASQQKHSQVQAPQDLTMQIISENVPGTATQPTAGKDAPSKECDALDTSAPQQSELELSLEEVAEKTAKGCERLQRLRMPQEAATDCGEVAAEAAEEEACNLIEASCRLSIYEGTVPEAGCLESFLSPDQKEELLQKELLQTEELLQTLQKAVEDAEKAVEVAERIRVGRRGVVAKGRRG